MKELEKLSLADVSALRAFIHQKYSGLFMHGVIMPGLQALADKYMSIMRQCDIVFEDKIKMLLNE